jgi:hypothetical protein
MPLRPIVMLWIEGQLGPIERLSLTSFRAQGHAVTLYAYGEIKGLPEGIALCDAREVLPEAVARTNRYANGSYALFSNLFRYEILRRGLGIWSDTDVVALQPLALDAPFIAGWESLDFLNGAVLYAEPGSGFVADALAAFSSGRVPPWLPFHRAPLASLQHLVGRKVPATALPHGTFGPKGVTALAKRHNLMPLAQPREVFYPLPPRGAHRIFEADCRLEHYVRPNTLAVHLWNEKLKDLKHLSPPQGSLLRTLYERYGV